LNIQVMSDARSFDAGVEVVADFALETFGTSAPKESGDIIGFDGVNCGTD